MNQSIYLRIVQVQLALLIDLHSLLSFCFRKVQNVFAGQMQPAAATRWIRAQDDVGVPFGLWIVPLMTNAHVL